MALGDQLGPARDAVAEPDARPPHLLDLSLYGEYVVKPGRQPVATARLAYREMHPLGLKPLVGLSQTTQQPDPTLFEPRQKRRMMSHAGLIGLGIADADSMAVHDMSYRALLLRLAVITMTHAGKRAVQPPRFAPRVARSLR